MISFLKNALCHSTIRLLLIVVATTLEFATKQSADDNRFISYTVNPKEQDVKLYWKDDKQQHFRSIQNLKSWLEANKRTLLFAMNAGMYTTSNSPLGLFIENKKTVTRLNTKDGSGNFYLKPNGVFYITTGNTAGVCESKDFVNKGNIKYATQSGPMLLVDGKIRAAFKEGSANLNIRNGVGLLPGNKVVFAMSKEEINFYDFAMYFKNLGCTHALYLDGFVSQTYLPEKNWTQTGGDFGVMIGVVK